MKKEKKRLHCNVKFLLCFEISMINFKDSIFIQTNTLIFRYYCIEI